LQLNIEVLKINLQRVRKHEEFGICKMEKWRNTKENEIIARKK
jgi:hypothetical protein